MKQFELTVASPEGEAAEQALARVRAEYALIPEDSAKYEQAQIMLNNEPIIAREGCAPNVVRMAWQQDAEGWIIRTQEVN